MNDFKDSKQESEKPEYEVFWRKIYRIAFPNMLTCISCNSVNGCISQRRGVDRLVFLSFDKVLRIEEKIRLAWHSDDDILLEYLSNDKTKAPGWMNKNLSADYLAYGFYELERAYLYSWLPLQQAWRMHRQEWWEKYPKVPSHNPGYTTWSIAVPRLVLEQAIVGTMLIDVAN